jgi:hypothetical protein
LSKYSHWILVVSEWRNIYDKANTYEFLLGWILVQSSQIPAKEDFAVLNGGTAVLRPHRRIFVITTVVSREYAGGNVVFEELAVDRVDDVGNGHTDKVLTTLESTKIICTAVSTDRIIWLREKYLDRIL